MAAFDGRTGRIVWTKQRPVLQGMGEPVFVVETNPTAEGIARLIFDVARQQGLPVSRVTVWETPTSYATYGTA